VACSPVLDFWHVNRFESMPSMAATFRGLLAVGRRIHQDGFNVLMFLQLPCLQRVSATMASTRQLIRLVSSTPDGVNYSTKILVVENG